MSEEPNEPTPSEPQEAPARAPAPDARRLRLEHREGELARHHANAFRTFMASEELVIDFGFNLVRMDTAPEGADGTVTIDWTQRTVLSHRTAKLLAMDLARLIREHERAHGEIPVPGRSPDARGNAGQESREDG